ncbi:MAG: MlaD family protein [Marinobacter sp.]|uniref:PqiB family protein n=1 Tax=Marinobacter sp. TaxID=50741 RepID=UPI00299E34A4|nr:MlaD family protein [Marinobacter sp.]MDX1634825.1 MlaD family protein [Marinobacter sp.]
MTDSSGGQTLASPEVRSRRWHLSLVWLIPLVAALVGLSMLWHAWQQTGPVIEISFQTAAGLTPGQTPVQYRNVVIGEVTDVALGPDRDNVIVTVELTKDATAFTAEDTRYWVVRPRIGAGGISGLDTLFSGDFIAADPGTSDTSAKRFQGLESPPPVTYGEPGKRFELQAGNLGSLAVGSPVYYRKVRVGQVVSYELADNGDGVDIEVFVSAPHDQYVTPDSRFWNASGIELGLSPEGLKLSTQSLVSILTGGIAFEAPPPETSDTRVASQGARFRLFENREAAMAPRKGPPQRIRMRFDQSLRGLEEGAPVDFLGKKIGRVSRVTLDYDADSQTFPVVVDAVIYPQLMGRAHDKLMQAISKDTPDNAATGKLFRQLVNQGLRAEARSQNLLTGQLYIAMEFYPEEEVASLDANAQTIAIPTRPTSLDRVQAQLTALVDRLDGIPFERIAGNLDGSLVELRKTLSQFNSDVLPATLTTLQSVDQVMADMRLAMGAAIDALEEGSPERDQLDRALTEVERMSRSVRELSDYLRRHPEALIRGRQSQDRGDLQP